MAPRGHSILHPMSGDGNSKPSAVLSRAPARRSHRGSAMTPTIGPSLLAVALAVAAGVALFQHSGSVGATREPAGVPSQVGASLAGSEATGTTALGSEGFESALPPNHPPINGVRKSDPGAGMALTPNHPATKGQGGVMPAAPDEVAALAWTAPPIWESAPSRSTMRLATYRVPAAAQGGVGAELSVTRAGGSTAENLERWVGQFDAEAKDTRAIRTVSGFRVTVLEVSGIYDGGMSSSLPDTSKPGWSLLGAVVETSGPFYFFKMVGPSDAVHAAKPAFEALLNSVRRPS